MLKGDKRRKLGRCADCGFHGLVRTVCGHLTGRRWLACRVCEESYGRSATVTAQKPTTGRV